MRAQFQLRNTGIAQNIYYHLQHHMMQSTYSSSLSAVEFQGDVSLLEAAPVSRSTSVGRAGVSAFVSVRPDWCTLRLVSFSIESVVLCSVAHISLLTLLARDLPLSHLIRFRTSEDSSVISPERRRRL